MAQITFRMDEELVLPRTEWVVLVKARADWKCERCGATGVVVDNGRRRRLHAHHRNHDDTDHRLSNGECLCISCHNSHHRRIWTIFRDPTVQQELSRRSNQGDTVARALKAWETYNARATPEDHAQRTAARVSAAAAQPFAKLSARSLKGWETKRRLYEPRTHCLRGHEYTPENTRVDANGWRRCKTCAREGHRRRAR